MSTNSNVHRHRSQRRWWQPPPHGRDPTLHQDHRADRLHRGSARGGYYGSCGRRQRPRRPPRPLQCWAGAALHHLPDHRLHDRARSGHVRCASQRLQPRRLTDHRRGHGRCDVVAGFTGKAPSDAGGAFPHSHTGHSAERLFVCHLLRAAGSASVRSRTTPRPPRTARGSRVGVAACRFRWAASPPWLQSPPPVSCPCAAAERGKAMPGPSPTRGLGRRSRPDEDEASHSDHRRGISPRRSRNPWPVGLSPRLSSCGGRRGSS